MENGLWLQFNPRYSKHWRCSSSFQVLSSHTKQPKYHFRPLFRIEKQEVHPQNECNRRPIYNWQSFERNKITSMNAQNTHLTSSRKYFVFQGSSNLQSLNIEFAQHCNSMSYDTVDENKLWSAEATEDWTERWAWRHVQATNWTHASTIGVWWEYYRQHTNFIVHISGQRL